MRLVMVGPPGQRNRDAAARRGDGGDHPALQQHAESEARDRLRHVNGQVLLRTIYPSIATQQSCVDCHNKIQEGWQHWKLNDVVGAFAVDVPAGAFLQENIAEAIEIALALFAACVAVAFYVSVLQYRHQRADEKVIEALKGREREMESAGTPPRWRTAPRASSSPT